MYPSSSSSSSQGSMGPGSLIRYGSAPGSFFTSAVDSVVGGGGEGSTRDFSTQHPQLAGRYFLATDTSSSVAETSESCCKANGNNNNNLPPPPDPNNNHRSSTTGSRLHRSYDIIGSINLNTKSGGGSLVRHSSSPAGFLNHLTVGATTTTASDNWCSVIRGTGSYNSKGVSDSGHGISRLNSELSFTRHDSLSHISEESEHVADGISADNGHRKAAHSFATASFGTSSWDDTNAIVFSTPPSKRAKNISDDVVHCINAVESEFQFGLPQTAIEMATMEKFLQIPLDSVPCKTRAKRGCATHPRSIAERERRTRISGKLKKLQDLVPNMDKQTSYSDMLDLAVQHIKGLQNQVQTLNKELENCTCGCKQTTQG